MQYFGSNIVEGVAESWVEAEMSWVEVDRAGWRWVHGLVIPVLISLIIPFMFIIVKMKGVHHLFKRQYVYVSTDLKKR